MTARIKVSLAFQLDEDGVVLRRKKSLTFAADDTLLRVYETISGALGGAPLWPKDLGSRLREGEASPQFLHEHGGLQVWQPVLFEARLGSLVQGSHEDDSLNLLLRAVRSASSSSDAQSIGPFLGAATVGIDAGEGERFKKESAQETVQQMDQQQNGEASAVSAPRGGLIPPGVLRLQQPQQALAVSEVSRGEQRPPPCRGSMPPRGFHASGEEFFQAQLLEALERSQRLTRQLVMASMIEEQVERLLSLEGAPPPSALPAASRLLTLDFAPSTAPPQTPPPYIQSAGSLAALATTAPGERSPQEAAGVSGVAARDAAARNGGGVAQKSDAVIALPIAKQQPRATSPQLATVVRLWTRMNSQEELSTTAPVQDAMRPVDEQAALADQLFDVVSSNDVVALQELVDQGVDVNKVTAKGSHVLFRAVIKARQLDVVNLLLQARSNLHVRDEKGSQVMHFWARATVNRNFLLDMGKALLNSRADVNAQRSHDRMTPLHNTVVGHNNRRGWLDFHKALMLVRHGADVHLTTSTGQRPLHLVHTDGRAATKKLLLLLSSPCREYWPTCGQVDCPWCA